MTSSRLSEDDIYRTSTQYRFWSFSPEQLAARRRQTHELAVQRAQQYSSQEPGAQNGHSALELLTEEEELRLVQKYCDSTRLTSDNLKWPVNVKATAVQYLKRFYLSNSCMTYPPKEIYKTVLFLASKTEAVHVPLSRYAHQILADPDAVLAPEYKIMQALRFTLDVRQPFRGLKGVLMELLNMAEGLGRSIEGPEASTGREMQGAMRALPAPSKNCRTQWQASSPERSAAQSELVERINLAYAAARIVLDAPASLTDAYFLYTPSQILLAAMYIADEPLTAYYLDSKLPLSSSIRPKVLASLQACAAMMESFDTKSVLTKEERAALEKKLDQCRDPTTKDLIKSHAAIKRNGAEDGKIDEQDVKRRKLEREKSNKEMDELFGPSLTTNTPKG